MSPRSLKGMIHGVKGSVVCGAEQRHSGVHQLESEELE